MKPTDYSDIQSLILYAYKDLNHAKYLLLSIEHPGLFRQWLGDNIDSVNNSTSKATSSGLNIAFTAIGLQKLGLPPEVYDQFSREFKEGMTTSKRSQLLGDVATNAPQHWIWGGTNTPAIDLLLLCYGDTEEILNNQISTLTEELDTYTVLIQSLDTEALLDRKEHFGFKDGISQPKIAGVHSDNDDALAPGEFLLGHENAYGSITPSPGNNTAFTEFGFNGSYLVFRQLEQNVKAFWHYLDQVDQDEDTKVVLASKMVGRWPNGAPLSLFPTKEPEHFNSGNDNDYDYSEDALGHKCPIASHTRRSNPRATDLGLSDKKDHLESVNHHRIMRRGRPYGKPLHKKLSPTAMLKAEDTEETRGLQFLCFNADLSRQFEFIQQSWINNEKFCGLYNDLDPLLGTRPQEKECSGDDFTIPQLPMRQRLKSLPQFVTTRGGAYFFMPSISALKQLATDVAE